MRNPQFKRIVFLSCILSLGLSSCISRLARPQITGFVVDYDKKPIMGCQVGETLTDKNGRFILPERRYNEFLLTEMMVMEAPPLFVFESIEKDGFESDIIYMSSPFGGGIQKGAKYPMDTIFLKKVDQKFDLQAILHDSKWNIGYTKDADTLYLVKDGFEKWCKTSRCKPFITKYDRLTDNYYHTNDKNLPDGMIRRLTTVELNRTNSALKLQQIRQYESTFDGPNIPPDTLNTKGAWQLIGNDIIEFRIDELNIISGRFIISDIDLYQLKLTKWK